MFQDLLYSFYIWLAKLFGINQDIIQIYHNKDIKLFSKDLLDITLKTSWCVGKAKKYNLVYKVSVLFAKNLFLLLILLNLYLMISSSKIHLGKLLGPA